jgi:hypothetical protein
MRASSSIKVIGPQVGGLLLGGLLVVRLVGFRLGLFGGRSAGKKIFRSIDERQARREQHSGENAPSGLRRQSN